MEHPLQASSPHLILQITRISANTQTLPFVWAKVDFDVEKNCAADLIDFTSTRCWNWLRASGDLKKKNHMESKESFEKAIIFSIS